MCRINMLGGGLRFLSAFLVFFIFCCEVQLSLCYLCMETQRLSLTQYVSNEYLVSRTHQMCVLSKRHYLNQKRMQDNKTQSRTFAWYITWSKYMVITRTRWHLSWKPGNVCELYRRQGNVRDFSESQNSRGKNFAMENCPQTFLKLHNYIFSWKVFCSLHLRATLQLLEIIAAQFIKWWIHSWKHRGCLACF